VHESPVRALEAGERPPSRRRLRTRLAASGSISAAPCAGRVLAVAFARAWEFGEPALAGLDVFERQLVAEVRCRSAVPEPGVPQVAAEATSSRTIGTQRAPAPRTDFSDFW